MATTLVQVRVDEELKQSVQDIYGHYGLDLPTAIRIFFNKTQIVNGLPFELREEIKPKLEKTQKKSIDWDSFVVTGSERGKNVDSYMKEMRSNDRM